MTERKEKVHPEQSRRVFVGMSGGVDSSVAALLLKNRGYDTVGVFMNCWKDGPSTSLGVNCAEKDAEDARRVAGKLGIPFYVWNFEEEYKRKVVDYMVDGYRRGLTPNPDVMCNKEIKFGLFLEKALSLGADYVATGHYVRLSKRKNILSRNPAAGELGVPPSVGLAVARTSGGRRWSGRSGLRKEYFSLFAAKDQNKDQSYFLWTLTQEQLKHCLFPIGDYLKSEVRAMAKKAGLPTAEKKDSQGICFLGKVTLAEFLSDYLPTREGVVLNAAGEEIGRHSGAHFYTIGQRHGLVSGDWKRTARESRPFYVADKNIRDNTIVVAEGESDETLFKKKIELAEMNFIGDKQRAISNRVVYARVRYRQPLAKAILSPVTGRLSLIFDKPQKFVAPGQSAVFYVGDPSARSGLRMLGGGVIVC